MSNTATGADLGTAGQQSGAANLSDLTGADTGTAGQQSGTAGTEGANQNQDYEKVAREKGWKPKEEFEGDKDSWVGAEEFIKRQPLFDKLRTQNKQIKELSKTVEAMAKHFNITVQQQRENMIRELKAERRELIEDGEVAKVEELDAKIEEIKSLPELDLKPAPKDPALEKFVEENESWWNKDKTMTRFAVMFNESYLADNPGQLEKSLEETLKAVKAAFPDKFKNPRRENPPSVETGGAVQETGGAGKYTLNRLTAEQKLVYNQLVTQHKQMTHEAYFKSLEEAGFLEG